MTRVFHSRPFTTQGRAWHEKLALCHRDPQRQLRDLPHGASPDVPPAQGSNSIGYKNSPKNSTNSLMSYTTSFKRV